MQIVGEHGRSGHWRYPADALLPRPPLFCAPAELLKVSVGLPAGFLRFVSVGKKKQKTNKPVLRQGKASQVRVTGRKMR